MSPPRLDPKREAEQLRRLRDVIIETEAMYAEVGLRGSARAVHKLLSHVDFLRRPSR